MANDNNDGVVMKLARKALSTAFKYIFKKYPPEVILLKAKTFVNQMIINLHKQSQNEVDRYNAPQVLKDEAGNVTETLPALPDEQQAYRCVSVVFTDVDAEGNPQVTVATAMQLNDGTIKPIRQQKFGNVDELLDKQVTRFIGPNHDNLNVRLSHMLLPSSEQEMKEDMAEDLTEEQLISQGPPKGLD